MLKNILKDLLHIQSKYSESDIGFKKISELFSNLSFYCFSYGEYEDIYKKGN